MHNDINLSPPLFTNVVQNGFKMSGLGQNCQSLSRYDCSPFILFNIESCLTFLLRSSRQCWNIFWIQRMKTSSNVSTSSDGVFWIAIHLKISVLWFQISHQIWLVLYRSPIILAPFFHLFLLQAPQTIKSSCIRRPSWAYLRVFSGPSLNSATSPIRY